MSIKISFKKNIPSKYIKNYVLFVNEDFKINGLSKIQLQKDSNFINQVIRSSITKKKNFLWLWRIFFSFVIFFTGSKFYNT